MTIRDEIEAMAKAVARRTGVTPQPWVVPRRLYEELRRQGYDMKDYVAARVSEP